MVSHGYVTNLDTHPGHRVACGLTICGPGRGQLEALTFSPLLILVYILLLH